MFYSSPVSWMAIGWHLHLIFAAIALVGGILFVAWALKLNREDLQTWVIWSLVVGILGILLTSNLAWSAWRSLMRGGENIGGGNMMNLPGMMNFGGQGGGANFGGSGALNPGVPPDGGKMFPPVQPKGK